jgi:prepilin-type processing-associated H-X9-DG protein
VSSQVNGIPQPTALEGQQWGINRPWVIAADPVATANYRERRQSYAWVFHSLHPGGAQFTFCDGSVHFLSETMDYRTFVLLNWVHDRQPVSNWQ